MPSTLTQLRVTGILEGVSFLLLLGIAMPLKYLAGEPAAVEIAGLAHGLFFLAYVGLAAKAWSDNAWPKRRVAWLVLASSVPFGPFVAEARLLKPLAQRREPTDG